MVRLSMMKFWNTINYVKEKKGEKHDLSFARQMFRYYHLNLVIAFAGILL